MFYNILVQSLFFWDISLCFVLLIEMVVQPLSTSFRNYSFSSTYLGAVVVVFVWWLKLQLPMHSVPITTYVVIPIGPWQGVLDTTLCDTSYQWLETGRWISPGTPVSSTNKTNCYDITDILLKVELNSITITLAFCYSSSNHKLFNSIYYSWIKVFHEDLLTCSKFYHP
jgi:hypothetical protein